MKVRKSRRNHKPSPTVAAILPKVKRTGNNAQRGSKRSDARKKVGFLDLDYDIRFMIYRQLFVYDHLIKYRHKEFRNQLVPALLPQPSPAVDTKFSQSMSLAQTCRTVYEEAMEIYYGSNRFAFEGRRSKVNPYTTRTNSLHWSNTAINPIFEMKPEHRFLRHIIVRDMLNDGTFLFSVHLTNMRRIMYACPSLVDMMFEVDISDTNNERKTAEVILKIVDKAIKSIPNNDVFFEYDLSRAVLVRGCRRRYWRAFGRRWLLSLGFTRQGHAQPKEHALDLPSLENNWNIRNIRTVAVRAGEFSVYEQSGISRFWVDSRLDADQWMGF
jgi:hypothetical protein